MGGQGPPYTVFLKSLSPSKAPCGNPALPAFYFSYLQVTFIHAFCVYCLVSAVITVLLLIAAISRFRFKQK